MFICEKKNSVLHEIIIFVYFAFLLGIGDLFLYKFLLELDWDEIFRYRFGLLNTSIATYSLILFLFLGAGAGLVNYVSQSIAGKVFKKNISAFITAATAFCLALILSLIRGFTSYQLVNVAKYYVPVFSLILISGYFAVFVFCKIIQFNRLKNSLQFLFFISFISIIGIFLLFPSMNDLYFRIRFPSGKEKPKYPNILLIIMDTVRADSLSPYQEGRSIAPNVHSIAKEGVIFTKAISPAPWTLPAHASIFTGLYPSQHKADWENIYLDDVVITMAEYLSDLGYQTIGITENPWVGKNRGLAQGFKDFFEIYAFPRNAITPRLIDKFRKILFNYREPREHAKDTVRIFKQWILKNYQNNYSSPFFAFLNFMPAHLPNYLRSKYTFSSPTKDELIRIEPVNQVPERFYLPQYKLCQKELAIMRALYLGDVAYLDAIIGELFDFLKETDVLDETILIITSDHGENFGDHGLIEHQFCLYNTLLHVPLIIRFPEKINPGTCNDDMVSTIFLFKTILDLIDSPINDQLKGIEERSLLKFNENPYIYAEYGNASKLIKNIIEDEAAKGLSFQDFDRELKCIYGTGSKFVWSSDEHFELYDMHKDWIEENNLLTNLPETSQILLMKLMSWQKNLWMPRLTGSAKDVDKKTEEMLRALGYIK